MTQCVWYRLCPMTDDFVFDEKEHAYFLNGKPMMGCTTVLSVIAKPALIQWAATTRASM